MIYNETGLLVILDHRLRFFYGAVLVVGIASQVWRNIGHVDMEKNQQQRVVGYWAIGIIARVDYIIIRG